MIYYVVIISVVVIILNSIMWNKDLAILEGFDELTWYRDNKCKFQMLDITKNTMHSNSINKGSSDNWAIYLPCGYNNSQKELDGINPTSNDQKIFIIKGCDQLSRKDNLWAHLEKTYGIAGAQTIMPRTYIIASRDDMNKFKDEYSSSNIYILKKNIQRQNGLKIIRGYNKIVSEINSGYVVVQKMLQNPYLIDGRKTNCRIYLLVVCKENRKSAYIYDDGFVYYTPKKFKKNSTVKDSVITTGYIDRSIYNGNPLTLKEFSNYITLKGQQGDQVLVKVGSLLSKTLHAVFPSICTKGNVYNQTTFQLFGCDVAFDDKLNVNLIEINKGPSLDCKDVRDCKLKQDMINNMFTLIGVAKGNSNRFLRII